MSVKPLLQEIWTRRDCAITPSVGAPRVAGRFELPDDLAEFFRLCGGAELFAGSSHPLRLAGPMEFTPSDPLIFGRAPQASPTASWFMIVRRSDDALISIDLAPEHLGRCYDSAWDRHGVSGNCPIVARSFTELLQTILTRGNGKPWWNEPGWAPLGDAFE